MSRQQLLGPSTKGLQIEGIAVIQHHGCGDALAPLRVGDADHGTLGNRGMRAQCFLDLERGYFVSAGLEDVNVGAAKNAIAAVLDDRRCETIHRGRRPVSHQAGPNIP